MRPCLFCGTTAGRATDEHVIPKWARDAFNIQDGVTIRASDGPGSTPEQVARLQHLNIVLRKRLCAPCNNEWLAGLERAVQPILEPMALRTTELVTLGVLSVAYGLSVWSDGRKLWWHRDGNRTTWPTCDLDGAARILVGLVSDQAPDGPYGRSDQAPQPMQPSAPPARRPPPAGTTPAAATRFGFGASPYPPQIRSGSLRKGAGTANHSDVARYLLVVRNVTGGTR